jgi:DNA-directed RNA polymerase specialized sigma24 family protein
MKRENDRSTYTVGKKKSTLEKKPLEAVSSDEKIILGRIQELVEVLKQKYQVTTRDVFSLVDKKEIFIPTSIFIKQLSPLETITIYLKEELQRSYHQIGVILNRNERNIWHTYNRARKKYEKKLVAAGAQHLLPVSIFQNNFGVLENIVEYLKEDGGMSYHQIAVLLKRNDRTIWTMYRRIKKKKHEI